MSINKTENYQLHAWGEEDEGRLEEINENFARLDTAARMVTGSYSGNGAESQTIELGFTPTAVLVMDSRGHMANESYYYGGLALTEAPVCGSFLSSDFAVMELTSQGFQVHYTKLGNNTYACTNQENTVYHYIALV